MQIYRTMNYIVQDMKESTTRQLHPLEKHRKRRQRKAIGLRGNFYGKFSISVFVELPVLPRRPLPLPAEVIPRRTAARLSRPLQSSPSKATRLQTLTIGLHEAPRSNIL